MSGMGGTALVIVPSPDAFAAANSWWLSQPRDGFTARAQQEYESRLHKTRFARALSITCGPIGPGTLDAWKAKKAMEASR